jgi:hypothetical protein
VTYFDQCYVGDKMTSAIGLFKSEIKTPTSKFLRKTMNLRSGKRKVSISISWTKAVSFSTCRKKRGTK